MTTQLSIEPPIDTPPNVPTGTAKTIGPHGPKYIVGDHLIIATYNAYTCGIYTPCRGITRHLSGQRPS